MSSSDPVNSEPSEAVNSNFKALTQQPPLGSVLTALAPSSANGRAQVMSGTPETEDANVTDSGKDEDTESSVEVFCTVCKSTTEGDTVIVCDRCDRHFHPVCLKMTSVPDSTAWYCPRCAPIVERQAMKEALKQARREEAAKLKQEKQQQREAAKKELALQKQLAKEQAKQDKAVAAKPPKSAEPAARLKTSAAAPSTPKKSPKKVSDPHTLRQKLKRAQAEASLLKFLAQSLGDGTAAGKTDTPSLYKYTNPTTGITYKNGCLLGPHGSQLSDFIASTTSEEHAAHSSTLAALFATQTPHILPHDVIVTLVPTSNDESKNSQCLPVSLVIPSKLVTEVINTHPFPSSLKNFDKYKHTADVLGGLKVAGWSVAALDGMPLSVFFSLLEPKPDEIRDALHSISKLELSSLPFANLPSLPRAAAASEAEETMRERLRSVTHLSGGLFPMEDLLLEAPPYRELRTALPPFPELTDEAAALKLSQHDYADLLQIHDFFRMFARISEITVGLGADADAILHTMPTDIDESSLLPPVNRPGGMSVLGSLAPIDQSAQSRAKQTQTISCVDPAIATLTDLAAAFSENSTRAFRLLSRLHVALLRVLIEDRDSTYKRTSAEEDDDGDAEDDGDDDDNDIVGFNRVRVRRRARRAARARQYEANMTNAEWELEVTLAQLNIRTWPEVLRRALLYGPLSSELRGIASKGAMDAVFALCKGDYMTVSMSSKLALCRALIDGVTCSDSFARIIEKAASLRLQLIEDKAKGDAEDEASYKEELKRIKDELGGKEKQLTQQIAAKEIQDMLDSAKADEAGDASRSSEPETFNETVALEAGIKPAEIKRLKAEYERKQASKGTDGSAGDSAVRQQINSALQEAYEKRDAEALQEAIANAKVEGYESGRGSTKTVDPHLQLAYVRAEIIEAEEKLAKKAVELRRRIQRRERDCQLAVEYLRTRSVCLGQDRRFRSYWILAGDSTKIYVQCPAAGDAHNFEDISRGAYASLKPHSKLKQAEAPSAPVVAPEPVAPPSGKGAGKRRAVGATLEVLKPRLVEEHPSAAAAALALLEYYETAAEGSVWRVINTYESLQELLQALDIRGTRERLLDANIRSMLRVLRKSMPRGSAAQEDGSDSARDENEASASEEDEARASRSSRVARQKVNVQELLDTAYRSRIAAETRQDAQCSALDETAVAEVQCRSLQQSLSRLAEEIVSALTVRKAPLPDVLQASNFALWKSQVAAATSPAEIVLLIQQFEGALYALQKATTTVMAPDAAKSATQRRGSRSRAAPVPAPEDEEMAADAEAEDTHAAARPDGWSDGEAADGWHLCGSVSKLIYPDRATVRAKREDPHFKRIYAIDTFFESDKKQIPTGEYCLWMNRTQRRMWRDKLMACTSFAQLALVIIELQDVCSSVLWCSPPISQFVRSAVEESSDDEVPPPKQRGATSATSKRSAVKVDKVEMDTDDDVAPAASTKTQASKAGVGQKRARQSKPKAEPKPESSTSNVIDLDETSSEDDIITNSRGARFKKPRLSETSSEGLDRHNDDCHKCGGSGELICCDLCPLAFHPRCVKLRGIPEGSWICPECQLEKCGSCGKGPIPPGQDVLCGNGKSGCDKPFHLKCVGLTKVPKGAWFCEGCRRD